MKTAHVVILIVLTFIVFGCVSLYLGQDDEADTRGYHSYIAWAWLNDQTFQDIAVDYWASYYNPIPEMPWYLLQHWTNSARVTAFIIGGIHGLLALGIGLLAYWVGGKDIFLGVLCFVCFVFSPSYIHALGTQGHDIEAAILFLFSLFLILKYSTIKAFCISGFIAGLAFGCKLTGIIFIVGFYVVIIYGFIHSKNRTEIIKQIIAWTAGVLVGFVIVQGYWSYVLWVNTGNPIFPLYNHIFSSPFAEHSTFVVDKWKPKSIADVLLMPYYMATKSWWTDTQYGLFSSLYIALVLSWVFLAYKNIKHKCNETFSINSLFLFSMSSFVAWAVLYGQARYLLLTDGVTAVVALSSVSMVTNRYRRIAMVAVVTIILVSSGWYYLFRVDFNNGRVFSDVVVPSSSDPNKTVVFLADNRHLSFLVPEFDKDITFIGLWSTGITSFVHPEYGSLLSKKITSIIEDSTISKYAMFCIEREPFASENMELWGLKLDQTSPFVMVEQRYDRYTKYRDPFHVVISPVERLTK